MKKKREGEDHIYLEGKANRKQDGVYLLPLHGEHFYNASKRGAVSSGQSNWAHHDSRSPRRCLAKAELRWRHKGDMQRIAGPALLLATLLLGNALRHDITVRVGSSPASTVMANSNSVKGSRLEALYFHTPLTLVRIRRRGV